MNEYTDQQLATINAAVAILVATPNCSGDPASCPHNEGFGCEPSCGRIIDATTRATPVRSHGLVKVNEKGQLLPDHATEWAFVLDTRTNLMWTARNVGDGRVKQPEAEKAAAAHRGGGLTDWRLPTRTELLTLVDDTRADPAINTDYFRDCASNWYWTSTPSAGSPAECAWFVYFGYGFACCGRRGYGGFVRAVRSVRAPSQ